jgi:hypothetical protein
LEAPAVMPPLKSSGWIAEEIFERVDQHGCARYSRRPVMAGHRVRWKNNVVTFVSFVLKTSEMRWYREGSAFVLMRMKARFVFPSPPSPLPISGEGCRG